MNRFSHSQAQKLTGVVRGAELCASAVVRFWWWPSP